MTCYQRRFVISSKLINRYCCHYTAKWTINLLHVQAELAQQEAEQLQEAGYFAEAAALSTTAHKWRKKAAKVSLTCTNRQTLA